MAEVEAGQENAQEQEQEQQQEQNQEQDAGEQQQRQAERTYTQAEVDRILSKVRKNARYLGRKEAEAELLRQGATPSQARQAVAQPEAPKVPKREDFENYEDYLVEKAKFEARQVSKEERESADKAAREKTVSEQRQKTEREFKKRAEEVMKDIPDFAEAIESAEDVMISAPMGEAIQESPVGPRILYHLVQNPDEADRIAGLSSAAAQAREIGKLEAKIEAELKSKAKPKGEEGEEGEKDEERDEGKADAKGEEPDRNADGTFKSAKKRSAPEPI